MFSLSYYSIVPHASDTPKASSSAIRKDLRNGIAQDIPREGANQGTSFPLGLPLKREREEDSPSCETKLERHGGASLSDSPLLREDKGSNSPMDQDVNLCSSIEIIDAESDDSVIDLTQEV